MKKTTNAAIAGAAIGAAAGAAAVLLSNKENREKVKKSATEMKKQADSAREKLEKKFQEGRERGNAASEKLGEAGGKVEEARKELS